MAATTVGFFWHPPVMPADLLRSISGTTWFRRRFIVSIIANAVLYQGARGGRENESEGHGGRIE